MECAKLNVKWSETESVSYYLDHVSCGWNKFTQNYWLKTTSGKYLFNSKTKKVTLNDGVKTKECNVKEWYISW